MGITVKKLSTHELTATETEDICGLLRDAFAADEHGGFSEYDWQHALGGMHFVLEIDGKIVAHAAVVERELHVAGEPIRTGYVEAVATVPAHQRTGLGTTLMREVNTYVQENFELGALGTGSQAFYERLGWQIWRGPSFVRTPRGTDPTPDEDGYILVLRTPSSPPLDLTASITCDWRPGDIW